MQLMLEGYGMQNAYMMTISLIFVITDGARI